MTTAQQGDTIKVHCSGTLDDGTPFYATDEQNPIEFTVGAGQMIPGFEQAVVGMASGQSKTVTIPAEQAYGPRRSDLIVQMERDRIPSDVNPQPQDKLQLRREDGHVIEAVVTEVTDAAVTLDANHPLAGQDLTFDIRLVEIT